MYTSTVPLSSGCSPGIPHIDVEDATVSLVEGLSVAGDEVAGLVSVSVAVEAVCVDEDSGAADVPISERGVRWFQVGMVGDIVIRSGCGTVDVASE
jgi:hypothetical protein